MVVSGFGSIPFNVPGGLFSSVDWTRTATVQIIDFTIVDPRKTTVVR